MKPDRSNYEVWLIDWLDGNLSESESEQLLLFLNENPDIKEESDDLKLFSLKQSEKLFFHKEALVKSVSDLTDSQFEYLSVAYLEKDLSSGQKRELSECIENNPGKKKSFELIQKLKINPEKETCRDKNRLLKRTTAQRIRRMSVWGLSAAAALILIIMTWVTLPQKISDKTNNIAKNSLPDSSLRKTSVGIISEKIISKEENFPIETKISQLPDAGEKTTPSPVFIETIINTLSDSLFRTTDNHEIQINRVKVNAPPDLNGIIVSNTLIASRLEVIVPAHDDMRTNLSRFIAKTFREKILKEKTAPDNPLKGYEIAEAGVTGLNKLFGWEMALQENNDANGELRSVYFSSRILKFTAPVKKSEPIP
jgi:hypothetical protein